MIFKLADAAQRSWRHLDGQNQLAKINLGVRFTDGIEDIWIESSSHCRLAASVTEIRR